MDNPKSIGELGEYYRRIAYIKLAGGCKACQMEGRAMLEMVEEMERNHANTVRDAGTHTASCAIGNTADTSQPSSGSDSGSADEVQQ